MAFAGLQPEPRTTGAAPGKDAHLSRAIRPARYHLPAAALLLVMALPMAALADGAIPDEFRVKRESVFEFASRPTVTRDGDRFTIAFESRGLCDVTVAVEDADGRIVRHLASGVLGPNAPAPFAKDSRKQTLIWDSKDDQGRYVRNPAGCTVRVSLGLKPRLERTLYWSPHRRASGRASLIYPQPEGVYVYDGTPLDHLQMFDHEGNYVRTVYPFPSDKVGDIDGLYRHTHIQDGRTLPVKGNFLQTTLLRIGTNWLHLDCYKPKLNRFESVVGAGGNEHYGMGGFGATGLAVHGGTVFLGYVNLHRFGADGGAAPGGLAFMGPKISKPASLRRLHSFPGGVFEIGPRSLALSPDGKTLYLAGYTWHEQWNQDGHHGVARMPADGQSPPEVFVGSLKQNARGTKPGQFRYATSVATDAAGRVYVTDYMNQRVQVFTPDGEVLTTFPSPWPAQVHVHQRTGEIYVFSWAYGNGELADIIEEGRRKREFLMIDPKLFRYAALPGGDAARNHHPKKLAELDLPFTSYPDHLRGIYGASEFGQEHNVALDSWTDPPTIWVCPGPPGRHVGWEKVGLLALREKDGKLELVRNFAAETGKVLVDASPPPLGRQRLYVNPVDGVLYVGEGNATGKSFQWLIRIDPQTGRAKRVHVPFDAEDMAFTPDGLAVLRTDSDAVRYDPATWREVPWDYGEQRKSIGYSRSNDGKRGDAFSAVPLLNGLLWHTGGMGFSPDGKMAITCYVDKELPQRTDVQDASNAGGKAWEPRLYPGRAVVTKGPVIMVFDRHGQLASQDVAPGLGDTYGVEIDREGNVYVMMASTRMIDGVRYYNDMTGTLAKFPPSGGRLITAGDKHVPIPATEGGTRPDRPCDVQGAIAGSSWVEGAGWLYGGVGYGGKNRGVGCACWNCRFTLDYFARSFAPEMDRYSVAVLDTAGNLVTRIGTYGNIDDGTPLIADGGPAGARAIGGDEVSLFHAPYLATHTDRRLFIADPGNGRIVSVKLDYHTDEKLTLPEK